LLEQATIARDSLEMEPLYIEFRLRSGISDKVKFFSQVSQDKAKAMYRWGMIKHSSFPSADYFHDNFPNPVPPLDFNNLFPLEKYVDYLILEQCDYFDHFEYLKQHSNSIILDDDDHLALGKLALRMHEPEQAIAEFGIAFQTFSDQLLRTEAAIGLAESYLKLNNYQAALDTLTNELKRGGISDDLCFTIGLALIRLGRTSEAIEFFQLSLDLNFKHERAHYYLGNGYTEQNYTQFRAENPQAYPDSTNMDYWNSLQTVKESGSAQVIERYMKGLYNEFPNWVDPPIYLASLAWNRQELEDAESYALKTVKRYPSYGRTHAILARIDEVFRMQQSRYYAIDDSLFNIKPLPEIPEIEHYVINWESLTRRHQKQTALCIAPWKNFLPVLAATGHTLYIKPLHEKLSDCPFLESIADLRISLDSRLWDDVRGIGGYHTVTGIEDVERSIFSGYNTILHELTHQVHGILTSAEKEQIEEAYQRAKEQESQGVAVFLSRYQASTVWEYFAEGVNAYFSPRRDQYDPKEVVRERLLAMDTTLVGLVEEFQGKTDMQPYYATGWVDAANYQLEIGDAFTGLQLLENIPDAQGNFPDALAAFSTINSILDNDSIAVDYAEQLIKSDPASVDGCLLLAQAWRHSTRNLEPAVQVLQDGIESLNIASRYRLQVELGNLSWIAGNYGEAIKHYEIGLQTQADLPEALWGIGLCWGDSSLVLGGNDSLLQLSKSYFEQVIPLRSGIVELRLDYARILLMHHQLDFAEDQIEESALLQPGHPLVKTLEAWILAMNGERERCLDSIRVIVADSLAPDLAYILWILFSTDKENRNAREKVKEFLAQAPHWIFNKQIGGYETIRILPAWQRRLVGLN